MQEVGRNSPIHLHPFAGTGQPVIIFLTICTKERRPLLASPEMHNHLREAWSDSSRWLVGRYVILPDHLHLFCSPLADCDIPLERWVAFWKNAVARKWKVTRKYRAPLGKTILGPKTARRRKLQSKMGLCAQQPRAPRPLRKKR